MHLSNAAQNRVVSGVIDGSIQIASANEFENLLKIFPDEPGLHRVYADYLEKKKSVAAAADQYSTAARLFVAAGMPLQAIVSKVLEWGIVKPSESEQQDFFSGLREMRPQDLPLQRFFTKMTDAESIALARKLVLRRFLPGSKVVKIGDEEKELSFVVYGALKKNTYPRSEKGWNMQQKVQTSLVEGDFFGLTYPFREDQASGSEVETITGVELATITRSGLVMLCKDYPNIEHLLDILYITQGQSKTKGPWKGVRESARHALPTHVHIKIFCKESDARPLNLSGFTDNISLGGACVVLGEKYRIGPLDDLIGKNVKIKLSLPVESVKLTLMGAIVWGKQVTYEQRTQAVVGIQFRDVTDRDRELLRLYCYGSDGEQNLIWSLWEWLLAK